MKNNRIFSKICELAKYPFGKGLEEQIFFLHIPKCGGTSARTALENAYNIVNRLTKVRHLDAKASHTATQILREDVDVTTSMYGDEVLKHRELILLYFMSQENVKFISGHFSFSELAYKKYSDRFVFIAMLRDPVKRWISHYFFQTSRGALKIDLREHLKSEYGQTQGYDLVRFIGGVVESGDYTSVDAVERAKENLAKFQIVGCLEHQEDFLQQLNARFGLKLKFPRKNVSQASKAERNMAITDEIEAKIREICCPDIKLYQYAIENFVGVKK